ncbi:MAG: thioredoxin [Candidatus Delongbacteria bacterium]|jgi:thioredoxin|nr:thioredoxin [Candidatus Delongbacteria bacterium]
MGALHVNDADFEKEVVKSDIPVLVDCWAEWCGPCRMVGPTIDKLADEYKGKFKITKLNVDDNRVTGSKYNIQSIPTMMIFVNGEVVDGLVGAHPEANIRAKLDKYIKK